MLQHSVLHAWQLKYVWETCLHKMLDIDISSELSNQEIVIIDNYFS